MKSKKVTVYEAFDGKIFTDEKECTKYEETEKKRVERIRYYKVIHNPDLTEGRGHYGLTLIECEIFNKWCEFELINDWCYRTFKRPIAYVQGCSPIFNWKLHQIAKSEFDNKNARIMVGDYSYEAKRIYLIEGEKELGLIEKNI